MRFRILSSLDEIPECDIIYSVQHHEILKTQHIRKARSLALNLHLAPLPEYRGCNQFSFAIMDEARSFGVSIHRIDERIDHGALLFEKRFSISPDIWVEDLYQKSVNAGIELFKETLPGNPEQGLSGSGYRYTRPPEPYLLQKRYSGTETHLGLPG
ncbi:MAG: hypothetical protein KL787_00100 [Taibaiella sp.]|nr:hypothetical protein [Taibaiella sp.]